MKKILLSLFLFSTIIFLSSWGFLVHRTVNQLAIYKLPKGMRKFFYENRDGLVKDAPRPDIRRTKDSTEAPKHFIDLEIYGDSAAWKMPMLWDDAVKKYSRDTLVKYGYVPYWILAMKEKLTNAFRSGNTDSIIFYATDMGHYIGDANVPLHTTVNYDGQLSGQRGIHALWESVIPELELEQYKLFDAHTAEYLDHPEVAVWEAIRNAHLLVKDMLDKEREVSKQFVDSTKYRVQIRNGREIKYYTSSFAKAYAAALEPTIVIQLNRSADLISDFWYTSWVDAGRPDLGHLLKQPFSHEEKKNMKKEFKAYRRDQLIEKKLLISRRDVVKDPANQ